MVNVISEVSEEKILDLINQETRIDKRSFEEYRDITVKTDYISKANGSALVSIGATTVVAGVKASITTPFANTPDEGIIITNTELLAIANKNFEYGPPNKFAVEISRVVDRCIREAPLIDLKQLCIAEASTCWKLHIDIYLLDFDGNIMDAAGLAAVCALLTTKIPTATSINGEINIDENTKTKLPIKNKSILCSVCKLFNQLVIDPVSIEENLMEASISIGFREDGSLCAIQKCGFEPFTMTEVRNAINIAFKKSTELFNIIKTIQD